jgi:hypothetical protein
MRSGCSTLTRHDEDKGDAVRRDEEVPRRVDIACNTAEQDVVGRNERARLGGP